MYVNVHGSDMAHSLAVVEVTSLGTTPTKSSRYRLVLLLVYVLRVYAYTCSCVLLCVCVFDLCFLCALCVLCVCFVCTGYNEMETHNGSFDTQYGIDDPCTPKRSHRPHSYVFRFIVGVGVVGQCNLFVFVLELSLLFSSVVVRWRFPSYTLLAQKANECGRSHKKEHFCGPGVAMAREPYSHYEPVWGSQCLVFQEREQPN